MKILRQLATFITCLTLNMLIAPPASATSLLPLTLEQLSTRANLIFYGRAIENTTTRDDQSGQIATYTAFEVIELIKGDATERHTIKQVGGQLKETGTTLRIQGVPLYIVGESYVLFLPEKSSLGFSSPLGLYQGSFTVSTIDGEQIVSNGQQLEQKNHTRNSSLPLAVKVSNKTQARLGDFIDTIQSYNVR
jgi:hypothetical protein